MNIKLSVMEKINIQTKASKNYTCLYYSPKIKSETVLKCPGNTWTHFHSSNDMIRKIKTIKKKRASNIFYTTCWVKKSKGENGIQISMRVPTNDIPMIKLRQGPDLFGKV